jgi:16S rRNA (guanine527-N7)-methyltransferase
MFDLKKLFTEACAQLNLTHYLPKNTHVDGNIDIYIDKLIRYVMHLQKWNSVYNLTAITDTKEIAIKHVIDCLAAIPVLHQALLLSTQNPQEKLCILDVGSGAGLPSIIWAILQPQWLIYSIDSVHKKIAFQQQVKIDLKLNNLQAMHERIQNIKLGQHIHAPLNIITARAYAHTHDIIDQTQHLLAENAAYALLKGKENNTEFNLNTEYSKAYYLHKYNIDVPFLDAQRCLIYISKN